MARMGKLSAAKFAALVRARRPGHYGDGGGLFLQVSRYGGSSSWVFRYLAADGKVHECGLGSTDTLGARRGPRARPAMPAVARHWRRPLTELRRPRKGDEVAAAKAVSFREAAELYIEGHKAGWKSPVHAAQWP